MPKNARETMGRQMPAEQPSEEPARESRRGRLGREPMLADASHIQELRAESQTMDAWQAAQMKRRIEGISPAEHAFYAMSEVRHRFNDALKSGSIAPEVVEQSHAQLQEAWNDIQEQQTELRGSTDADAERQLAENWDLIKSVNQLMEVTMEEDPSRALERYGALKTRLSQPERATEDKTRREEMGPQIDLAERRVQTIEAQIKETFGVDADMLLSGAKPTQNRLRYMLGSVMGGDALIKRLREARQEEEALKEKAAELKTSVREKAGIKTGEKAYVKSKRHQAAETVREATAAFLPIETTEEREAGAVAGTAEEQAAEAREHLRRTQREEARAYRKESGKKVRYGAEMELEYLGEAEKEAKRESSRAFVADVRARTAKAEQADLAAADRIDRAAAVDQSIRDRLTAEMSANVARPLMDRVDGIMGSDVETQMKRYGFTPGDYYAAFSSYIEAVRDLASMEKAPRDSVYKGAERRVAKLKKEIDDYAKKLDINNEVFLRGQSSAGNEAVPLTKAKKMGAMPRYELSTDEEEVTQRYPRPVKQEEPTIEATELEGSEAEAVRTVERRSGKLEMSVDRAREILSQDQAYALWELANKAIEADPSLAKSINGLEKGKDNPATKFVYAIARAADAINVNADMPQQMILRDHAQELAKALGLLDNPIIKNILAQERRTAQKTAVEAARRRQARSAASRRSFTKPGM